MRSLVHVSALGVLGTAVIVGVIILTLIGIITIPLAGIGLALLVVALYVVFVLASFEIERTWVLYGIDVPRLVRVKGEGEGIAPFLKMAGLQALDLRMWRSFLNLGVSSLLGVAFLFIVWVDLQAVGTVVTHLFSSVVYFPFLGTLYTWQAIALTVIFLMISVPTVVGIGLLRASSMKFMVLPSRDSLNKVECVPFNARVPYVPRDLSAPVLNEICTTASSPGLFPLLSVWGWPEEDRIRSEGGRTVGGRSTRFHQGRDYRAAAAGPRNTPVGFYNL